ncbi:MAG: peptidase M50 [Proteobacteria bacterium]|nr:HlyD family efflux transporter periplasmic adaptor subunit [Desulfobulbaceae bacterium]MBU4153937.1 peptidase M50 [Pseudomonadota bacterium]
MKSQFSQLWYRVENLKPRLRAHVRLSRHSYWGRIWYVILDTTSSRVHRFTIAAYMVIGLMDGKRTVGEIWTLACGKLADKAPSQDDIVHLLGQLHNADVLQCEVTPDAAEIFDRYRAHGFAKKIAPLMNPLSVKIPLFDPEQLLFRLLPFARLFFTIAGGFLWLMVVTASMVLAGKHWPELTSNIIDRILTPQNVILLWFVFPCVKILHELGHAFAAKVWGGEVHELGVMFLVFTPVPYVDVSTTSAFRSRFHRMLVASAGMMVELFVASLALLLWVNVEPGIIRTIAYNVIIIAGVSTILFNINPLLRFDGYYIFSDLLELPNLSQRSTKYLLYLTERYLFQVEGLDEPTDSIRERAWLVLYAVAALVYRLIIVVGILFIIAQKSLFLGVIFAIISCISMVVIPVGKGIDYLLSSPRLTKKRQRAITSTGFILAMIVGLVAIVPFPLRTQVEGVVWLPEDSFVRAETDGFGIDLEAVSGATVSKNQPLARNEDPLLLARIAVIKARIDELEARLRAVASDDRVQVGIIKDQLFHQQAALSRAMERIEQLIVKSQADGVFVVAQPEDFAGKFFRQGETLGYVIPHDTPVKVRVIVPQEDVNFVRGQTHNVDVRLARNLDLVLSGPVIREVPLAAEYLPDKILGTEGGGKIAVDPNDDSATKTFSRMFQFDVELPLRWEQVSIGDRIHVRFDHGFEPLLYRWVRLVRQVFLSKLDV